MFVLISFLHICDVFKHLIDGKSGIKNNRKTVTEKQTCWKIKTSVQKIEEVALSHIFLKLRVYSFCIHQTDYTNPVQIIIHSFTRWARKKHNKKKENTIEFEVVRKLVDHSREQLEGSSCVHCYFSRWGSE